LEVRIPARLNDDVAEQKTEIRTGYADSFLRRYAMEGFFDPIPVIAGLVQTILYTDFFYIYWTKIMQGKQFNLPV
jgi:ER lumen protein retaining receptor